MGLLYINITFITSPWTSKSTKTRCDQQGFTWLTHYPAERSISCGWFIKPLKPAVEGVGNPSFSIIQHRFNGQLRSRGAPRWLQLQRAGAGGEVKSELEAHEQHGGIRPTCPGSASNWVPNELELFTLYQNNLWWQLCLMTNFLCHFTLRLPWSSVRFQPLEEKYVY